MSMIMECQRCGGDIDPMAASVKLFGNVTCNICSSCRTLYAALLNAEPGYKAVIKLAARDAYYSSLSYTNPVSEEDWSNLFLDKFNAEQSFHQFALDFIKPASEFLQRKQDKSEALIDLMCGYEERKERRKLENE